MAVAAVDAVPRDVTLMAELNGLLARHVHLRDPRGSIDLKGEVEKSDNEKEGPEDATLAMVFALR